jgi:polysaccharide export outer membrane protein
MRVVIFLLSLFLFSSCYYNKKLVYLQDDTFSEGKPSVVPEKKPVYKLRPYDILSVQVKSVGDAEAAGIFNVASPQNLAFASPGSFYLEGYSIDASGKIILPVIGSLHVQDLTIEEAQKLIQLNADKYLNGSTVIVRLTSFKVTVLGEVKNPGYYYVYNNQATLLEALGMAGDLTTDGSRERVKLVRPVPGGSEVVFLNLTDANLLKSPYYFLTPGDVIYVEPLKARSKRTNLDLLTVLFSALTTAVLVLSYVNTTN